MVIPASVDVFEQSQAARNSRRLATRFIGEMRLQEPYAPHAESAAVSMKDFDIDTARAHLPTCSRASRAGFAMPTALQSDRRRERRHPITSRVNAPAQSTIT